MRWEVAAVVAIVVLGGVGLAGCSGDGGSEEPATDEAAALAALEEERLDEVALSPPTTDTLWLTAGNRLNTTAVSNLTILATLSGAFPQTFTWNATFNGTGNLSAARLVLWLDLQNSALQPGVGGDAGCTASMTLALTLNGTTAYQAGGCASLGTGTVPPGEHRLDFSTLLTSFPGGALVHPGDGVLIQVAFGLSLPQGVGHLLAGAEHDSRLRLAGLSEPLPIPVAMVSADNGSSSSTSSTTGSR